MDSAVEAHLPLAERVIRTVCRRKCQSPDEAEDFSSWALLKLLEDDGAVFRKFRGKSSLSTYLTTVMINLFRDYRVEKWGKWRPSSEARRLGPSAVRLETLLWRDGIGLDEAVEMLRQNFHVAESREQLEQMSARLPQRPPRRFVDQEAVPDLGVEDRVEDRVRQREASRTASRIERSLATGLHRLSAEDRLILKLWAQDGFTVAAIAQTLGLDQKPLYRRLERLKLELRKQLESNGIGRGEVHEIIDWPGVALHIDYGVGEGDASRPSQTEGSS